MDLAISVVSTLAVTQQPFVMPLCRHHQLLCSMEMGLLSLLYHFSILADIKSACYIYEETNLNKSHSIYSRAVFITLILHVLQPLIKGGYY